MSHFAVVVIGPADTVENQLAPYHEFECTGTDNQYVQDVDKTAEARTQYEDKATDLRFKDPEGGLHNPFDEAGNWAARFRVPFPETDGHDIGPMNRWEKAAELGCYAIAGYGDARFKVVLPDGWTAERVPSKSVESFAEWAADWYGLKIVRPDEPLDLAEAHKFGHIAVDANGDVIRIIDRTNPNKKWDWWVIGGRWSGFFRVKPGVVPIIAERSTWRDGPIFAATGLDTPFRVQMADMARKGDIDFAAMRDESGAKAATRYDRIRAVLDAHPGTESWSQMRQRLLGSGDGPIDAVRKAFWDQPAVKALQGDADLRWEMAIEDYMVDRDTYIRRARNHAVVPFAVLKDGQWYQKGDMGWWGLVSNEQDPDTWDQQVNDLFDGLPDDTMLTCVDCHI